MAKSAREPLRVGKFLKLVRMTYGMGDDAESGELVYTSRVVLGVRPSAWTATAREKTREGTVTAIDLALRTAIAQMGQEVPEPRLWPYHITLVSRSRGTSSPVIAQARIALDGWRATRRVRHADGVTAAAFLLFDAYDHLLFERWRRRLANAGVTPEEVFRSMRREAAERLVDA